MKFSYTYLQVSERLSNPNIFIAHNRSDAFAGEDTQVRSKNAFSSLSVVNLTFVLSKLKYIRCTETKLKNKRAMAL